jgi:hypothetical protein
VTIEAKAQRFRAYHSFGLCHQVPPQGFDAAASEWLAGHARQVFAKIDSRLLASDGALITSSSSSRRSYWFLCWSPPSRARQVAGFAGPGQTSRSYFAASAGGAALAIAQYVEQQRQRASSLPKGRGFRALKIADRTLAAIVSIVVKRD